MNRAKIRLIWLLAASSTCFGCKPELVSAPSALNLAIQPCEQRAEFESELNIVLLDRTTRLSQQDRERWARGLTTLLSLNEVAGRIEILDLVALGKLPASPVTVCYPASLNKPPRSQEPTGIAGEVREFLSQWRYGTAKREPADAALTMEVNAARKKQRDLLVAVPEMRPVGETKTTDVERPVREAISKRCQSAQVCRLLMFTDLMDTNIQRALLSLNVQSSSELGTTYANKMLDASGHWSPEVSIQVVVWNFGRDERGSDIAADDDAQQKLEAFWSAYFSSVCRRAASGSGIWISLEGPRSLPRTCL